MIRLTSLVGSILLNLDTEEDDELTIGCAGGIDTNTTYNYQQEATAASGTAFEITIKGLKGGHSGMDIHKGRANANKLMNRLFYTAIKTINLQLSTINGGSLRNAIPRESSAVAIVTNSEKVLFEEFIKEFAALLKEEYETVEPGLTVILTETVLPAQVMVKADFKKILNAIYAIEWCFQNES
ncbi:peptidase dimerization domain-containing protein [Pedobacter sp. NJ-S-72]